MITTPIYNGQGIGNQLANYVTTRCIALDHGYDWGIAYPERFKGHSFMKLDMGKPVIGLVTPIEGQPPTGLPDGITSYYEECEEKHPDGTDIRGYDEGIFNLPDNTCVHGLLQGEDYFKNHREEIKEWLKVEPMYLGDNLCIINFRGGEYKYIPDFFLPHSYWNNAIDTMKDLVPDMEFEVHTDDFGMAHSFFPDYPIISNIETNWRAIRHAKYLILSNSSFALLPAWLGDSKDIIAPWGFGRYNKEYWSLKQNIMKGWHYQKKDGTYEIL